MTHQPSFSQAEFAGKKKITRREKFLARMESVIPWAKLLAVLEPFYPKGERGRPPIGLERMLRMYFLQQWYGLDARAREQLERTSWLWRKNPESWTTKEGDRWMQLKDKPLVTGLAYAMRLELQRAYAATTVGQARKRFETWSRWVRTEAEALTSGLLEPMRQAADMVERHLEGILAHWQQGLTTAFLEGLNSLFSATKRKARGYRSTEYQTAMLYFIAGKLEIPHYA